MNQSNSKWTIFPILFGFFVMGFVDVVGISTNYVKHDFGLSDTLANLIPMMVFLWFAIFSIPTGMLMGRIGRRNTVANHKNTIIGIRLANVSDKPKSCLT